MAKKVLLDCLITINAVDYTAQVSKVEVDDKIEDKEVTNYGSNSAKEYIGGLESGSIKVTFKNDYAAAAVDTNMWALRRQVVAWTVRAGSGAKSASNPEYSGNLLVNGWTPISGTVGDVAEVSVDFPLSGPMARAIV